MLNNKPLLLKQWLAAVLLLVIFAGSQLIAVAASASKINQRVNEQLEYFTKNVDGASNFLKNARGVLVFPKVYNAAFGVGGEYGEGALRIGNSTVAYYNVIAGSYGLQIGAQKKTVIIVFMDQKSLDQFTRSKNWEIGADAAVTLVDTGLGKSLNTENIKDPVVGFVFDQQGLMAGVSLKGMKITKIKR